MTDGTSRTDAEESAGRELRRLRTACGWSQEQVALRMDAYGYEWHQTTVAKIEGAQRPLRLNELADMCDLFGVTLAGLLTLVPGYPPRRLRALPVARAAQLEAGMARIREVLEELETP